LDRSSDCSWDRPSARSIRNRAIGTPVRPSAANDSTDSTRIVARSRSSGPSNSIPKPESNGSIDRGNAGASQTLSPLGHAAPGLAVPVLVSSVLTWSFIRFLAKPARILNNDAVQGGYQARERAKTHTSGAEVAIAIGRRKVGDENPASIQPMAV
jgi:hypothetical protein